MALTEAQRRAKAKYERENVVQKQVRFYPADADALAHALGTGEPFGTYVKRLIREDMERAGSGR